MGPYYRLLKEELVQPVPAPAEPFDVELAGCDEIYDHFQIKLALCFKDLLPCPALKDSLAKALGAFPMLSGRARRGSKGQAWVQVTGQEQEGEAQGVLVREQVAHFRKGQLTPGHTKPHLRGLCGGQWASRVNDPWSPLLTVTLSEVVYSEGLACRTPILACTREGEDDSPVHRHSGHQDEGNDDIRFVIGISVSHSVCDGCALSVFLLQWVYGQDPSAPLTPALHDRGLLLLEEYKPPADTDTRGTQEGEEEVKGQGLEGQEGEGRQWEAQRLKRIFTHASSWRKAYVIGCLALSALKSVWVTLSFTHDELEALKEHAMAPLLREAGVGGGRWVSTSNALAAHLWPILSHAWGNREGRLCPLSIVINSRKALGIPLNYCGNVVTLQPVEPPSPPHHQDLTHRALQVREGCVVTKAGALVDHSYMQRLHKQGHIARLMHRSMRDVIEGRAGLVWDDVSSLVAIAASSSKRGGGGDLAFAGSTPIAMDVQMADVPGMVFVLAPPPGQNLGGKEVRVMLPSHVATTLNSPKYQQRIHAYSRLHRTQTGL